MKQVVIVGGGITGLAAAYTLQEHARAAGTPVDCTLLEAGSRLGGSILTERADGFVIEAGPDSFLSTKPWALELCERLGLTERLVGTNRAQRAIYILSGDRLHPVPEGLVLLAPVHLGAFIRSPLLSMAGKARMALDVILPRRHEGGDESLGAFVRRRLGREVLEKLVAPLFAGIYAGQADRLSLRSVFPRFCDLEQEYRSLILGLAAARRNRPNKPKNNESRWTTFLTFRGGMTELVETLVGRLNAVAVRTGSQVRTVRPAEAGPSAGPVPDRGGYDVRLADGRLLHADAVIVTTPAYAAAELLGDTDRPIAEHLRAIPYASTATVSLGYRRAGFSHPLNGFGFVVPRTEGRRILACTWTSTKFSRRAPPDSVLLRCFVGGAGTEAAVAQDDDAIVKMVRDELRAIMGVLAPPVLTRVYRWAQANPQYVVGHGDRLAAIDVALAGHPGLFLAGSAYRGVGIPDCIHQGAVAADQTWRHLQSTG